MKYKRECPKCRKEIFYTKKSEKIRAEKRNTNCRSCSLVGKVFSNEHKKKLSENHCDVFGKNNPMYGKKRFFSKETRKRMRISALKRIGQVVPNHNPKAIPIIRAKAKELGITDLQDAETLGGEYQVCGYFVDGYSLSKNIVIEYYEPFHKNQVERDERRQQEIIEHLGCKFIIIKE